MSTRRRGQWDRSEAYFNEAERLDPRNAYLLSQHAQSYLVLRRFPEALRKLDQVLNITPDDVDTLVSKAVIAQAEGDLPRAAALLAPLHPNADDTSALETQVYQAILERRPAPAISRLKEILAKPDPALGYNNGELRFFLGWAQEVGGEHAAAQESWRQARSELESFLKEQPDNYALIGDMALTSMALGDKAAALALAQKATATSPLEKDALDGSAALEFLARVSAQAGEPDRAITAIQKLLSIPSGGSSVLWASRLLPRCSGSIQCSIRSGMIRASKNSARKRSREPVPVRQHSCHRPLPWIVSFWLGRMKVLVYGNSGSGKSTYARALVAQHGLAHLDLDSIVWEPGKIAVPREPQAVLASLVAFISTHQKWVID